LGAFLLLRIGPLLEASPALSYLVAGLGLVTAVFAVISGRVQSDIKSALAFASLTQVGLIVAEIGLGFRYLPLAHIIGHACLRTLQLLRAPTLLKDYQVLENAIGQRVSNTSNLEERILPLALRRWVYRIGLERGYLDACLDALIIRPFLSVFVWCDAAERRWTDYLSGQPSRESDRLKATSEVMEELL
jgi:NAD(P)H-quinone oxidoreductase subunit 5